MAIWKLGILAHACNPNSLDWRQRVGVIKSSMPASGIWQVLFRLPKMHDKNKTKKTDRETGMWKENWERPPNLCGE